MIGYTSIAVFIFSAIALIIPSGFSVGAAMLLLGAVVLFKRNGKLQLDREDRLLIWAEEVLQESFVRIWHNAGRYDAALSAPLTWMINITRNLAIDQLRRRREESLPESGPESTDERADDSAGPHDLAQTAQEKAALDRCLDTLEGKQRQSIVIAYFQGISYAELAQQMSAPLGSVKSWIRRGMERLRTCLES